MVFSSVVGKPEQLFTREAVSRCSGGGGGSSYACTVAQGTSLQLLGSSSAVSVLYAIFSKSGKKKVNFLKVFSHVNEVI
jgi:hypothetical protein